MAPFFAPILAMCSSTVTPRSFRRRTFVRLMQAVRRQRQDAGKCSGADRDHHEQAHAEAADGRGQNKRADPERSANLPDKLLAGGGATHMANGYAVLHHYSQRGR